ncbi:Putative DNA-binding protein [Acidisarcina polymorpha]|uniref:DNA-binding protein n=2 Tax=Acidisarcina polymorpha TaxID=2211140 RepID=A0A2Z5G8X8_9BACT|nr:Putative DNA-binding protein [Acidisarcina polymorpha]
MLDRLARALVLEETEREHLYLLAHGRPPEVKSPVRTNGVSPRMQRVLDALESSPALIKDAAWNVVAWNEAAAAVLIDYGTLSPVERNVLRLVFCHPRLRAQLPDWEQIASFVVATFRAELARTGASQQTQALIEALSRESPEFAAMWRNHEVRKHGEGIKRVQPEVGESIALEYSSFAIDAQVGLSMVVYMPATHADAERVKALVTRRRALA